SKIKLSAILTSFENHHIKYNKEKYKWINSYCQECSECITHCEPQALIEEANSTPTKLIETKCTGSEEGCTYCIEKCPFNQKSYQTIKKEFQK
ncbi:MAG: 4Fe-4S binding protein, partial [Methanobacteriaceae archaeon]